MIEIEKKLINLNFSSRNNTPIKYIVVHDTGNNRVGADSYAHFSYFNSADRNASAHYFIDSMRILQVIEDSEKAWHCGDGYGKNGITNENSIGIEMCVNADGDFEEVKNKTLTLINYLLLKYDLDKNNVVRHYDASGKICPDSMYKNNWAEWEKFKERIEKKEEDYTKIINKLYINLYGREGDTDGINYWNRQLNLGMSIGEMLKNFAETKEFKEIYN